MLSFDKIIIEYQKLDDSKKKNFNRILFRKQGHFTELLQLIELLYKDDVITKKTAFINMTNIPGFEGRLPSDLPFITIKRAASVLLFNSVAVKHVKLTTGDKIEFIYDNEFLYFYKSSSSDAFILNQYGSAQTHLSINNANLVNFININLGINTKKATYRLYFNEDITIVNNIECYKIERALISNLKTSN